MTSLTISTSSTCTATHLVIMGVSGCGKTTLGEALAKILNWPFFDADDFHPTENVAKMKRGEPLNDYDRAPWLNRLNALLRDHPHAILACSALKEKYRAALKLGLPKLHYVHPHGAFETIANRIEKRSRETGHYMPSSLLQSQFDALEPCLEALMIDIDMPQQVKLTLVLSSLGYDVSTQE